MTIIELNTGNMACSTVPRHKKFISDHSLKSRVRGVYDRIGQQVNIRLYPLFLGVVYTYKSEFRFI